MSNPQLTPPIEDARQRAAKLAGQFAIGHRAKHRVFPWRPEDRLASGPALVEAGNASSMSDNRHRSGF